MVVFHSFLSVYQKVFPKKSKYSWLSSCRCFRFRFGTGRLTGRLNDLQGLDLSVSDSTSFVSDATEALQKVRMPCRSRRFGGGFLVPDEE